MIEQLRNKRAKSKSTNINKEIAIVDTAPAMTDEERGDLKEKLKTNYESIFRYLFNTLKHTHPLANLFTETGRMYPRHAK